MIPNISATSGCSTLSNLTSNPLALDQTLSPKLTADTSTRRLKATAPVQLLTVQPAFSFVSNRFTAITPSACTLRPASFSDAPASSDFHVDDGCDSDNGSTYTPPSDASFSSAEEFTDDDEFFNNEKYDRANDRIAQLWNYSAFADEDEFIDMFCGYWRSALAYMRMGPDELRDVRLRLSNEIEGGRNCGSHIMGGVHPHGKTRGAD